MKTKYWSCFKEPLKLKSGPRRSRECTPLNSLRSFPRVKVGTEAFCRGVKEVELSKWRSVGYAQGPLFRLPPSSRVSDSLLLRWGEPSRRRASNTPPRPLTLPETRQKGRSNHGPERGGEQEVSILQRRKTLTRTPTKTATRRGPQGAGGGARGCRGRPPPHPGPAPVPPTPGSRGA